MGRLAVKVVPGSSRDQIVGRLGDALKIKVTAPPEKGKANTAVVTLLAKALGIGADQIEIVSGHSSPSKVFEIAGMDDDAIKNALGQPCPKSKPPGRPSRNSTGRSEG